VQLNAFTTEHLSALLKPAQEEHRVAELTEPFLVPCTTVYRAVQRAGELVRAARPARA
jgi:hypothetical protein